MDENNPDFNETDRQYFSVAISQDVHDLDTSVHEADELQTADMIGVSNNCVRPVSIGGERNAPGEGFTHQFSGKVESRLVDESDLLLEPGIDTCSRLQNNVEPTSSMTTDRMVFSTPNPLVRTVVRNVTDSLQNTLAIQFVLPGAPVLSASSRLPTVTATTISEPTLNSSASNDEVFALTMTSPSSAMVTSSTGTISDKENIDSPMGIQEIEVESTNYSPPAQSLNINSATQVNVIDDGSHGISLGLMKTGEVSSPCLVCADKGSGYHYSAYSCEGCKGFFKRSVQKNLAFTCKIDGNCIMNKYTRNSCQYCRFQKCLLVGMKTDAVREDRSPGGKHRSKRQKIDDVAVNVVVNANLQALQQQNSCPVTSSPPPAATASPQAEDSPPRELSDEFIDAIIHAKPHAIPKVDANLDIANLSLNDVMQYGYIELRYIIDWAKKVPGFRELNVEDQMALLKSSFMELNVLRLSFRSMEYTDSIKFAEGLVVQTEKASSIGWGSELVNATAEFGSRLREVSMDVTEFCLLNAMVLTYPGHEDYTFLRSRATTLLQGNQPLTHWLPWKPRKFFFFWTCINTHDAVGIKDKQSVMSLQTKMLDAMRRYIHFTYPNDVRRFGKMLLRLPALRTLSAKAAEKFLSLTLEGSLQLNALVSEMMI